MFSAHFNIFFKYTLLCPLFQKNYYTYVHMKTVIIMKKIILSVSVNKKN